LGAVVVGSAVSSNSKRSDFKEHLGRRMRERGLGELVNCELGRNDKGLFWQLTIQHPLRGIHAVVVRVGQMEPYSNEAIAFVLDRVARWGQQQG
jgi:hypothetical protein